jgi:hypothetical protein
MVLFVGRFTIPCRRNTMRLRFACAVLALFGTLAALPTLAEKVKGSTVLKDLQTSGVKDKNHKHQAYDLFFSSEGRSYTCRTDSGKSMNATDFVVGTTVRYEINGDNAKIWSSQNKKVECKIVRVEASAYPR